MSELATRRLRRLLGAAFVGGLTIGFLPGVASATPPEPPPAQPTTAFSANVPAAYEPFTDVTGNQANIECAAFAGLTQGTATPTLYNPGGVVTRAQMASFIARLLDTAKALDATPGGTLAPLPAYDGTNEFTDNPDPAHVANINRLADVNIVLGGPGGTSPTTYGGSLPVQRDQMASFINRAQDFLSDGVVDGDGFSSSDDYFTDDETSVHEANINAIASRGIAIGDGVDTYNPTSGVTHDQMSSFLVRHLADNLDAGLIRPVPSLAITPASPAALSHTANPDATATDDRQYSVSNLDDTKAYVLALFSGADVQTTGPAVTFDDATGDNVADRTAPAADITVVFTTTLPANTSLVTVTPAGGKITFTVDGDAADETVVPVLWLDSVGGGTGVLNLTVPTVANNDPKTPAEEFGTGGSVTFVPDEAPLGASTPTVTSASIANNYFVATGATYFYDGNDVFQYQAAVITPAEFESMVSAGDILAVVYDPDPAGTSVFNITGDDNPLPFAITSAAAANLDSGATANDVQVTFTPPAANAAGVVYALQRGDAGLGVNTACGGGDDVTAGDGTFQAVVGSAVPGANGTLTLTEINAATGCYDYRVVATNPVSANFTSSTKWVVTSTNGVTVL